MASPSTPASDGFRAGRLRERTQQAGTERGSQWGQSAINLASADEVQIGTLILNGQTITVPQGSAPAVPSAGSSYSETWCTGMETVANFLIAALQDAGIITS